MKKYRAITSEEEKSCLMFSVLLLSHDEFGKPRRSASNPQVILRLNAFAMESSE